MLIWLKIEIKNHIYIPLVKISKIYERIKWLISNQVWGTTWIQYTASGYIFAYYSHLFYLHSVIKKMKDNLTVYDALHVFELILTCLKNYYKY